MPITIQGEPIISVGDTDVVSVDLQDYLDSGETFTGSTPTIVEVTTTDLTLSNKAVNTSTLIVDGRSVGIGQAIQCKVSGQLAGRTYRLQFTCATTASRTITFYVKFQAK